MIKVTDEGNFEFWLKDRNKVPYISFLSSSTLKRFTVNAFYNQVFLSLAEDQFVVDLPGIYINWVPGIWFHLVLRGRYHEC